MVHQYKLNGYNIVLDTCSGSVHAVDEVAYDIIEMYKSCTAEEITAKILEKYKNSPEITEKDVAECIEDIQALEERPCVLDGTRYGIELEDLGTLRTQ